MLIGASKKPLSVYIMRRCCYICVFIVGLVLSVGSSLVLGDEVDAPIALRAGHFTVPPSTGPVTHVFVKNLTDKPYQGSIGLRWPEGWRSNPLEQSIFLDALETKQIPFAIENATDRKSNQYPVEITARSQKGRIVHKQTVVCASAPYFKPKIDGNSKDWSDAIGVSFSCRDKKTVVKTYWNQRQFCLLVEVEEDKLIGYRKKSGTSGIDAVRFALFPKGVVTGTKATDKAQRYEFMLCDSASLFSADKCLMLLRPEDSLGIAQSSREFSTLVCKEVKVVVKRQKKITRYECSVPYSLIPGIKLGVGRELGFSLLVHDADGTGIRDWSETMGLWPSANPFAWCVSEITPWGNYVPGVNKIEWGLCSSKH